MTTASFSAGLAELEFRCALYHFHTSSLASSLLINVKRIRDLNLFLLSVSKWISVIRTFIDILRNIPEYIPCLSVALPSSHPIHCARVRRQGHVKTQLTSDIFTNHLRYSKPRYSATPDCIMTKSSSILQWQTFWKSISPDHRCDEEPLHPFFAAWSTKLRNESQFAKQLLSSATCSALPVSILIRSVMRGKTILAVSKFLPSGFYPRLFIVKYPLSSLLFCRALRSLQRCFA